MGVRGRELKARSKVTPEWAEPAQACDRNSGCSQGVERIKGMEVVRPGCGSFRTRKKQPSGRYFLRYWNVWRVCGRLMM